jgi:Tol biopolymer transport system component
MGTVAYMSPEQAQGMDVDHRADIWALGCVLYEMVCGQRPFRGVYDKALLYEIVSQQPEPLTGLRTGVPIELEFLTSKCLAKDAADRYQHASEAAVDLRTLAEKLKSGRSTILHTANLTGALPATAGQTANPAAALPLDAVVLPRGRHRALLALATLAGLAFLATLAIHLSEAPPEAPAGPVGRFSFVPEGVAQTTAGLGGPRPNISPDGKYILYVDETGGKSSLWVRALASEFPRRLDQTEGGIRAFWSPDSQSIGFGTDTELKRMSLERGIPITLCAYPAPAFRGGAWSPDGETIVFSSGARLYRIPARGGAPELLREDQPGGWDPIFLPSVTPALVFTRGTPTDSRLSVLNLETGEAKELRQGDDPGYSRGYLIHGAGDDRQAGIWAMPFSLETIDATGESFPIDTGGRRPAVSRDGILTYEDYTPQGAGLLTLVWRSRSGEVLGTIGQPQAGNMAGAALSPDGKRVAVIATESGNGDVWVHDVTRSTKTRLTFASGNEVQPVWSSSGQEIVYSVAEAGIERKAADGTGDPTVLTQSGNSPDLSRDGRYLVYNASGGATVQDIFSVELSADGSAGEPRAFISGPAAQGVPKLSPDGRFLAYVSNESGRFEIYVRPFPDGAGKWQASVEGGGQPRWHSDGKELFFVNGVTLMAVSVSTDASFTLGQPQRLFDSPDLSRGGGTPNYDVSADGQRFVTIASLEELQPGASEQSEPEPPKIRVVLNWQGEFRDRKQD